MQGSLSLSTPFNASSFPSPFCACPRSSRHASLKPCWILVSNYSLVMPPLPGPTFSRQGLPFYPPSFSIRDSYPPRYKIYKNKVRKSLQVSPLIPSLLNLLLHFWTGTKLNFLLLWDFFSDFYICCGSSTIILVLLRTLTIMIGLAPSPTPLPFTPSASYPSSPNGTKLATPGLLLNIERIMMDSRDHNFLPRVLIFWLSFISFFFSFFFSPLFSFHCF